MTEAGLVAIIVATFAPVSAVVVAAMGSKRVRQIAEDSAVTREQVQNSHTSNLRDDLDRVADRLDALSAHLIRTDDRVSILTDHVIQQLNRKG